MHAFLFQVSKAVFLLDGHLNNLHLHGFKFPPVLEALIGADHESVLNKKLPKMKLKCLETPRLQKVALKIEDSQKLTLNREVYCSNTHSCIKEFTSNIIIIVESTCEHNCKTLCRINNQEMFTQDEKSL